MIRRILAALVAFAAIVWLMNTSLFSRFPEGSGPRVIAHRGQHQVYDRTGLDNETCTATRIGPPAHPYLENTLASMQAAFSAGAAVVELDVHLTPDGKFAVFHDWTLDCRTDLAGVTENTPFTELAKADIGYGYTADGGRTFPFRGKGIGLMPELDQVFEAFPDKRFLVNFKSERAEEGTELAARLSRDPKALATVFGVYGGGRPTEETLAALPALRGYTRTSAKECLLSYLATGWSGHVPTSCRNRLLPVPVNYAPLLWGWPVRFVERMQAAGTDVILLGPYGKRDPGSAGIDSLEEWKDVPKNFPGLVWTNRIENAREWAEASGAGPIR